MFASNPENENLKQKREFAADEKKQLRIELINLLILNYKRLYENNYSYEVPEEVRNLSKQVLDNSNELEEYIFETFEFCEGSFIKQKDIREQFKMQKKDFNLGALKTKLKQLLNVDFYTRKSIDNKDYKSVYYNVRLREEWLGDDLE